MQVCKWIWHYSIWRTIFNFTWNFSLLVSQHYKTSFFLALFFTLLTGTEKRFQSSFFFVFITRVLICVVCPVETRQLTDIYVFRALELQFPRSFSCTALLLSDLPLKLQLLRTFSGVFFAFHTGFHAAKHGWVECLHLSPRSRPLKAVEERCQMSRNVAHGVRKSKEWYSHD